MKIQLVPNELSAKIKVLGIGGAGGNAINDMITSQLVGVDFIAANTDAQALERSLAPVKIQLGTSTTRGLGAGGDPEVGKKAAQEDAERIQQVLQGADMVFVAAGMGGGTGTGGAPIVAELSRELGSLTVAVVSKPFEFEGKMKRRLADNGIEELRKVVDTIITIPNDRLFSLSSKNSRIKDVFGMANEVLGFAVRGISDLIMVPGFINVDFADVRTVMKERGMALMGTGIANGGNRAVRRGPQGHLQPAAGRHLHPGRPGHPDQHHLHPRHLHGRTQGNLRHRPGRGPRRGHHQVGPGLRRRSGGRNPGDGHRHRPRQKRTGAAGLDPGGPAPGGPGDPHHPADPGAAPEPGIAPG